MANNTYHKGNNYHNDEATATAETTDGRFFNVSAETDCQESLHESQQRMEESEDDQIVEIIESLPIPSDDVEHDERPDESEGLGQSRKRRKKKRSKERIALMA